MSDEQILWLSVSAVFALCGCGSWLASWRAKRKRALIAREIDALTLPSGEFDEPMSPEPPLVDGSPIYLRCPECHVAVPPPFIVELRDFGCLGIGLVVLICRHCLDDEDYPPDAERSLRQSRRKAPP